MSEPKLISPMLDNFEMGAPISEHDGVRCCPAMRKDSDEKYIVKIISVPASQTKLDALLLTGVYPDRVSALTYFHEVANGIVDEKRILDTLANLEGFVPFEDSQVVPMEDGTGYDVYLLSEYRLSLERSNGRGCMTQLNAVNLGLDLCAALAVARRSGYMCVDLKPSNIYVVGDKDYRIGDLGFVRINSLKYESLPDMYRSSYTAPEVEDAFAPLNDTMDIYSLGLILYQIYNGGTLPFSGKIAPSEAFEAPAYADEEIAQIILKACDPNPENRWKDPVAMGQAIVNYMQKNGVNDTPIVPVVAEVPAEKNEAEELSDQTEIEEVAVDAFLSDTDAPDAEIPLDDISEIAADEVETDELDTIALVEGITAVVGEDDAQAEISIAEPAVTQVSDADSNMQSEDELVDAPEASDDDNDFFNQEYDNLSFLSDFDDETAKALADLDDGDYEGVTDDLSDILNQIDELTAHQIPDPVQAPDPIEIKIPDPIVPKSQLIPEADPEEIAEEVASVVEAATGDFVPDFEEDLPEEEMPYVPKKKRTGLIWLIVLTLLVALAAGAYFFYTLYYLQPIHSLTVSGSEDRLNVQISADIDESMLKIVCADSHGKKVSAPVVDGQANFSGLAPDTAYTVSVEVDGFHKLTGSTSKIYSTPLQTKIMQMSAVTGSESGSVILNFTVEGPDSEQWNVIYSADGEAERVTAFPSHMVTLTGLTVGKEYSFRLEPVDDIYLTGDTEFVYTAKDLLCAEDLHVVACSDGVLTVQWNSPDNADVTEWTVRCSNQSGYDQTVKTNETTATFQDIDDTTEHTIEVIAADMSVSQRVNVGANSVTLTNFSVDTSKPGVIHLSWNSNRDIPAAGWTIRYTVNNINAPTVLTTNENSIDIPAVPSAEYTFTILDGSENPVLGGPFTHTQPSASSFESFEVTQEDITVRLCKTPAASSWSYKDLEDEDYVNTFSAGEKVSMVLALAADSEDSDESVYITFAIFNENDELIRFSHETQTWKSLWYQNYCELDIPGIPSEIGTYNVIIYLNGQIAGSQKFEITS